MNKELLDMQEIISEMQERDQLAVNECKKRLEMIVKLYGQIGFVALSLVFCEESDKYSIT